MKKRKVDISVISDVHLGTYDSHADELITYLNSIVPKKLILNGDILDIRESEKGCFPPAHLKVLRKIIGMAAKGTEIIYITGESDKKLRKLNGSSLCNLNIVNDLLLDLDGKKTWFFHGDLFDISLPFARRLAKLGNYGCKFLLILNGWVNWWSTKFGNRIYFLSRKIKNSEQDATKYSGSFEKWTVDVAIENNYDFVVCGHTHHPKKQGYEGKKGKCMYLNSGDWVENLTALEYAFKRWKIYRYNHDKLTPFFMDEDIKEMDIHELIDSITRTNDHFMKSAIKKEG